jgi:hypothetical protein
MEKIPQPTKKSEPEKAQTASSDSNRMTNFDWGLLIGIAASLDLAQIILDFWVIGVVVNRFIDLFFGMTLSFVLWIKGVKMDSKKIVALACAFVGEMIPVVDSLPLWTADVFLIMSYEKVGKKVIGSISGTPIQGAITKANKKFGGRNG